MKSYNKPGQHIKKQRHYLANKGPSSQTYGFSSSHVWMWELDYKEGWMPKNCCFWTVVLEKTLESPLDSKEIKPVNPKGNQSEIFIGKTDAEAEAPILWPPDEKSQLIRKDPDAGKDWRQEEKGMTEGETVGWYHWLNGRDFEQALQDGEGQGSLACCSPWGCKESDTTEQLNNHNNIYIYIRIYPYIHTHICIHTHTHTHTHTYNLASLVAQMVKNLPAMQDTQIWSLGREDLLEKGMAAHSNILAREISWSEKPGGL